MREKLLHPVILGLASIVSFVIWICCVTTFDSDLIRPASFAMLSIAVTLAVFVVLRSILSLFTQTLWSKRSSFAALVLLGCFIAWTTYRWKAVRWYGGTALFSTDKVDPSLYEVEIPLKHEIIVPDIRITEVDGGVIGEEEGRGPRMSFSSSTSQPDLPHSDAASRPADADKPD